jgi:transposase
MPITILSSMLRTGMANAIPTWMLRKRQPSIGKPSCGSISPWRRAAPTEMESVLALLFDAFATANRIRFAAEFFGCACLTLPCLREARACGP